MSPEVLTAVSRTIRVFWEVTGVFRPEDPSQRRDPLVQWHSVIFQITWFVKIMHNEFIKRFSFTPL